MYAVQLVPQALRYLLQILSAMMVTVKFRDLLKVFSLGLLVASEVLWGHREMLLLLSGMMCNPRAQP